MKKIISADAFRPAFRASLMLTAALWAFSAFSCGGSGGNSGPPCGNGKMDEFEVCDGFNLRGYDCASLGFGSGRLSCLNDCSNFNTIACSGPLTCHNNYKDPAEICDGMDMGGATCNSQGYDGGILRCQDNCSGFDYSGCGAKVVCNDGVRQGDEVCDIFDTGGKDCVSLGFQGGMLTCKDDCKDYDRSLCAAPPGCNDGVKSGIEICDKFDLGGVDCASLGYNPGTLACKENCAEFDVSGCGPKIACNNNKKELGEACDGYDFGGLTCQFLGYDLGGSLSCVDHCGRIDDSGCKKTCVPQCGERKCGKDPVCGSPCGECDAKHKCEETTGTCEKICDIDEIAGDYTLNINLETAVISGVITLDGAQMPDNTMQYYEDYNRGSIKIADEKTGDAVYIQIGAKGRAAYLATLFKGKYDIYFVASDSSYQNVLPYQTIILANSVELKGDRVMDFNLETAALNVNLTLNGAQMPDNTKEYYTDYSRGNFVITNKRSRSTTYLQVSAAGQALVSTRLFKDLYSFDFYPNDDSYQNVLPHMKANVVSEMVLNQDMSLSYDLKTAVISGVLTLNRQQVPDNTKEYYADYSRGTIRFVSLQNSAEAYMQLSPSGPAAYQVTVFRGEYDVWLNAADSSYQNVFPYQRAVLQTKLTANNAANIYDFNVETAQLSGELTLNGAQVPDNTKQYYETYNRGTLRFYNMSTGDYAYWQIGPTGPVSFVMTLFKATYNLWLSAQDSGNQDVFPYQTIVIKENVALGGPLDLRLNVDTGVVAGEVTINGNQMTDNTRQYYETYNRASLKFINGKTGDAMYVQLGATGPALFNQTVFKDVYDVWFVGGDESNQNSVPSQSIAAKEGVNAATALTELPINLETAFIHGDVTVNGLQMPSNTKEYYEDYNRASLKFVNKRTSDSFYIQLGSAGPASYGKALFKGVYDVWLTAADSGQQNALPDQNVVVEIGCFAPGSGCKGDAADITGAWFIAAESSNWGTWNFYIKQTGTQITGNYRNNYGQSGGILSGKRQGDEIEFTIKPYCSVTGRAVIIDGCTMKGSFEDTSCGNTDPNTNWTGYRAQ